VEKDYVINHNQLSEEEFNMFFEESANLIHDTKTFDYYNISDNLEPKDEESLFSKVTTIS
jgi:hypothetical protein